LWPVHPRYRDGQDEAVKIGWSKKASRSAGTDVYSSNGLVI
jgi:hypothetical protein